ncbi:hypothetical protein OIU77_015955, partial [Salix suchowensis]
MMTSLCPCFPMTCPCLCHHPPPIPPPRPTRIAKMTRKPSMPADQHRQQQEENTEQKPAAVAKTEPGEVESSCKQESHQPPPPTSSNNGDSINDPKRVKSRILANRQSAQRSRV